MEKHTSARTAPDHRAASVAAVAMLSVFSLSPLALSGLFAGQREAPCWSEPWFVLGLLSVGAAVAGLVALEWGLCVLRGLRRPASRFLLLTVLVVVLSRFVREFLWEAAFWRRVRPVIMAHAAPFGRHLPASFVLASIATAQRPAEWDWLAGIALGEAVLIGAVYCFRFLEAAGVLRRENAFSRAVGAAPTTLLAWGCGIMALRAAIWTPDSLRFEAFLHHLSWPGGLAAVGGGFASGLVGRLVGADKPYLGGVVFPAIWIMLNYGVEGRVWDFGYHWQNADTAAFAAAGLAAALAGMLSASLLGPLWVNRRQCCRGPQGAPYRRIGNPSGFIRVHQRFLTLSHQTG